jgi:peptidoglycan/xylan/chitin deacetylase (PgdA/CDA1 family)
MRLLAREGLAVSLDQLKAFLAGEAELPRDAVLVTVDDGFRSLLGTALPILRDFAIPAVAFVSAGLLSSSEANRSSGDAPEPYLRWEELDALLESGVSIQSHGISHRSLTHLSTQEAYQELLQSRRILEDRLGLAVDAFAYPFGTRADFNATVAGLAKDAGYQLAFTSQHGPVEPGSDLFTLSRTKVEGGETLATFAALVHGGLDAWRWIDRGLWRMQASSGAQG